MVSVNIDSFPQASLKHVMYLLKRAGCRGWRIVQQSWRSRAALLVAVQSHVPTLLPKPRSRTLLQTQLQRRLWQLHAKRNRVQAPNMKLTSLPGQTCHASRTEDNSKVLVQCQVPNAHSRHLSPGTSYSACFQAFWLSGLQGSRLNWLQLVSPCQG